jgi:hypothetical protein
LAVSAEESKVLITIVAALAMLTEAASVRPANAARHSHFGWQMPLLLFCFVFMMVWFGFYDCGFVVWLGLMLTDFAAHGQQTTAPTSCWAAFFKRLFMATIVCTDAGLIEDLYHVNIFVHVINIADKVD